MHTPSHTHQSKLTVSQLQKHTDSKGLLFCFFNKYKFASIFVWAQAKWHFWRSCEVLTSPAPGIFVTCHAPQWKECHQQSSEAQQVIRICTIICLLRIIAFCITQVLSVKMCIQLVKRSKLPRFTIVCMCMYEHLLCQLVKSV